MTRLILFAILSLLVPHRLAATIIVTNVPALDLTTVQAVINGAGAGINILYLPAGEIWWNGTLRYTNTATTQYIIRGHGTNISDSANNTIIHDNLAFTAVTKDQAMFRCDSTTTNLFTRITRIALLDGTNRSDHEDCHIGGIIQLTGQSRGQRVDHCFAALTNSTMVYIFEGACGVVDHYWTRHYNTKKGHGFFVDHSNWKGDSQGFGDLSWADDANLGTTNLMWFEDNDHEWINIGGGTSQSYSDAQQGGRFGIRYSNLRNTHIVSHGAEIEGNRVRGCRLWDVNNCIITTPTNQNNVFEWRSGTGVIWSNTVTAVGVTYFSRLDAYRIRGQLPEFWGSAFGTNGWDKNIAGYPYEVGVHNGGDRKAYFQDTTKSWTTDQWKGFSMLNETLVGLGLKGYGMIMSNTANTLYFNVSGSMWMTNGHTMSIGRLTNGIDVTCNGKSDLNTDSTPKWLNFAMETAYIWGNTLNGSSNAAIHTPMIPIMQEGSWYSNNVANPTYTPLAYPHPLVKDTINISPTTSDVVTNLTQQFTHSGDGTEKIFRIAVNNSGGSINSSTGLYTAGPTPNVVDTIEVWDNWGNVAIASASTQLAGLATAAGAGPNRKSSRRR